MAYSRLGGWDRDMSDMRSHLHGDRLSVLMPAGRRMWLNLQHGSNKCDTARCSPDRVCGHLPTPIVQGPRSQTGTLTNSMAAKAGRLRGLEISRSARASVSFVILFFKNRRSSMPTIHVYSFDRPSNRSESWSRGSRRSCVRLTRSSPRSFTSSCSRARGITSRMPDSCSVISTKQQESNVSVESDSI